MLENKPILGKVQAIFGRLELCNITNKAQKAYARATKELLPQFFMSLNKRKAKMSKVKQPTITFDEEEARWVYHPHNDLLVVTVQIVNHHVFKVLVDNGSSTNILYTTAFEKMRLD